MTFVKIDNAKGLYQESLGSGLSLSVSETITLDADNLSIDTSLANIVPLTAAGNISAGAEAPDINGTVSLTDGSAKGQLIILINESDSDFDFADGHLSISLLEAAPPTLVSKNALMLVWNGAKWSPTSQTLS